MIAKRYRDIACAVFDGVCDEDICHRMRISKEKLIDCFRDVEFCDYMELLYKKEELQTRCRLMRHGTAASDRLVELLGHDKDDTARKAAVDILAKCIENIRTAKKEQSEKTQEDCEISEEQAKKMLTTLAEGIIPASSTDH